MTSGSEVEASKGPNPNAPRRLREKIKEPIKFTPPGPSMKKGGKKVSYYKQLLTNVRFESILVPAFNLCKIILI